MKVTLLSPYSETSALGIRAISAYLKRHGITTRLVFMPLQAHFIKKGSFGRYPDDVIRRLADIVKDDDLVGVSVMSNYYPTVRDLTERLKTLVDVPVAWGGIHPTVSPEQSINYADYICIGPGEVAFLRLCEALSSGGPLGRIDGIWSKEPSTHVMLPGESILDLDEPPYQDYDLEENYILRRGKFERITMDNLAGLMGVTYWTYYTRGCPFKCSYCCNNALKAIGAEITRLRHKSPRYIVDEIKHFVSKMPFIRFVYFSDDTFFALSEKKIAEFAELYKKELGIPFVISGLEPTVFTDRKYDLLVDAGLIRVRMGIQTASERVLGIYERQRQSNEMVLKVTDALQKHSDRLTMPAYDVILDNPWETREEHLETIDLLSRIKPPYTLNVFSLTFFPGTELYRKALAEELINEEGEYDVKHYHKKSPGYLNLIITSFGLFKVPRPLLEFMLKKQRIRSERMLEWLINLVDKLTLYRRGFASLFRRDYSMFPPAAQILLCRLFPPRSRKG